MEFDFGYEPAKPSTDGVDVEQHKADDKITDLNGDSTIVDENGNPIEDLENHNDDKSKDKNNKGGIDGDTKKTDGDDTKNTDDTKETTLEVGSKISVGDDEYTVDESGNLIDKNGAIFKQASEVKEWIKGFDKVDETTDEISINTIQEAIGVEITDENDNPIEFDNTPEGIKSYVDAVIESARDEHYQTAINTLYQKYPILNDVLNYYIANGNSLEGFGEIPDRSNITIDDENEAQQEAIIRTAWNERGQKGDVEGYLAYLKSSGTLLATAKEELTAIQESDKQYRDELAAEAERKENERIQRLEKYWNSVHDVVKSRNIAGYQIPDSIIINRNGQKLSVTPEDFFNYIYRVDKDGKSAYERDLAAETPESRRDDEILRAYLKFVGGNYSNLVDMAINKEKVNKLKLRAKERNASTIRINKPKTTTAKGADIDLGYN